jgi:UPF0755 protein
MKFLKAVGALLILLLIVAYVVFFWKNPSPGNAAENEAKIIVPKGTTVSMLVDSLEKNHVIRSASTFKLAASILRLKNKLNPGGYRIAYGLSNMEIIKRLTGSEYALMLMATFPEGITMLKASRIAANKLKLDSNMFRKLVRDTAYLREMGLPSEAKTAEGYLFPDTYQFFISADPKSLITLMIDRWGDIVNDSIKKEIAKKGMSVHEFMTLASIVEAEARVPAERDTIAGVYYNRLRIGMKLDADPTVQYGHGLERPINGADVRRDNPYNTYLRKGLPPGPINNPGKAAILATLNPAKHDFLYFVARRDGSGGHYFSKSINDQTKMIGVSRRNAAARDTAKQ